MNANSITDKSNEFKQGKRFKATVKVVHESGVNIEMPENRGAGVILPQCWGKGATRVKALSKIKAGDQLEVVVRSYNPENCSLLLVLAGYKKPVSAVKRSFRGAKKPHKAVRPASHEPHRVCQRKPDFKPIAAGSVFLVDVSNLLGKTGVEHAAQILEGMSRSLSGMGYKSMFFIERRSLTWARCNQLAESEVAALVSFFRRDDAVVIEDGGRKDGSEADCAMLQMAEALQNSICVTCDHFADYAKAHPAIVGSDRVRSFSIAKHEGKMMVLVNGLKCPIVVELTNHEEAKCTSLPASATASARDVPEPSPAVCAPEVDERKTEQSKPVISRKKAYAVTAEQLLARGKTDYAIRYLGKVAKSEPDAYCAIADIYRNGKFVPADAKKAVRYERLARKYEKRIKERNMRDCRLRAESARSGYVHTGHLCSERMKLSNEGRKVIRECCKRSNRLAHCMFGHAA